MIHRPVLLAESIEALAIRPEGRYLDATFGRGGHSAAILERLGPQGRLIALDQDAEAIAYGRQRFADEPRLQLYQANFNQLQSWSNPPFDGILFDLGVSSPQLDQAERGFSFQQDGPLDMRMNQQAGPSAADWLNQASEKEIATVIFRYGEERYARRIARAIVQNRPLSRTLELADLIAKAVPRRDPHKHPATRSFQAIRIHINRELEVLEQALQQAVQALAPNGRLVVISFHSLEDRLVKRFIKAQSRGPNLPKGLPLMDNQIEKGILKPLYKIKPSAAEMAANPRARSALLRVAQKND